VGKRPVVAEKPLKLDASGLVVMRPGWRESIERTVAGLHYDLVDVERAARGLLRITIDRLPDHAYPVESEFVIVEDCELVTRQLQYALEVDGVDYARLEVSSPGLDRPLKREADYARFVGQAVSITLKDPFEGRKVFKGVLGRATEGAGWTLVFTAGKQEQVLGFNLEEVREARLVPVLDFKGRRGSKPTDAPAADGAVTEGEAPTSAGPGVIGG
jgi:ribosome maturation factor RimP